MNLTPEEYRQLEAIKILYPWADWLARDEDSCLYAYSTQPIRNQDNFDSPFEYSERITKESSQYTGDILPSLTWESEPLNIDEALEGRICQCYSDHGFDRLNTTYEYSGVDIGINSNGVLRVRAYDDNHERVISQDMINVPFCPNCGRRLEKW